jgi:succinoglycan biosynthesis protein ExoW
MRGPIYVIVPFYQVEKGLLARAVASIAAQSIAKDLDVIIVDDGSPVPAIEELQDRSLPFHDCRIIRQPNEGVGAARNTGLSAVPSAAEFVAFLDSDDQWTECHLARASHALHAGADVYFSKVRLLDDEDYRDRWPAQTLFAKAVPGLEDAFFVSEGIRAYTLQYGLTMQSLVFRRAVAPRLRFASNVQRAGEDLQFSFALVGYTSSIVYSNRAEVLIGRGVNIYRSTIRHGADHAISRISDQVRTRVAIGSQLPHKSSQAILNNLILKRLISDLALQLLHVARRGRVKLLIKGLLSVVSWPRIWPSFIVATLRHAKTKLTRQWRPPESS